MLSSGVIQIADGVMQVAADSETVRSAETGKLTVEIIVILHNVAI